MSLPEITLSYSMFIDKATLLMGESKTGKTVILTDILYQLKSHIEQIIIFSQTDKQTRAFSKGIVPSPLIHDTITDRILEDIYQRQLALSGVYNKIWSDSNVIPRLFAKIDPQKRKIAEEVISAIRNKLRDNTLTEGERDQKEVEINEIINSIYRKYITQHVFNPHDLNEDEQYALKYINLNPRLVILFDDCTELIKKFNNHHVMNKLFYQGRHAKITTLMACHTDKALNPEFKKNVFMTIFTDEGSANAYFMRGSTSMDKEASNKAKAALKLAFVPTQRHQKLLYSREEKKFYKFTATLRGDFEFCSPLVRKFTETVEAKGSTISKTNKYGYAFGS